LNGEKKILMKNNKILLIGKDGQVGAIIKNRLKIFFKNIKSVSRKEFNLEDLSLIEKKLNKIKPNIIINAAAYTRVDEAEKKKRICYKINALSTKKIASWCFKNQCFLIYYSTDYIFSGKNNKPWNEEDKPNPINFYGKSKLDGEKYIIKSKCPYLILRVNWIYANKGENFPKKIIKKIKKNKIINVVNDQIGTPNHADFIAVTTIKILKKILKNPGSNPKILNLSAKGAVSYYDFAKKIKNAMGKKYKDYKINPIATKNLNKHVKDYSKMKRPLNSKLNINKLENFLKEKMPNWELIFIKNKKDIIKNYIKS
tara:strand:- start:3758 stop:4696 length:939 start_codon:yes stop_codon:yes gene_type:complete